MENTKINLLLIILLGMTALILGGLIGYPLGKKAGLAISEGEMTTKRRITALEPQKISSKGVARHFTLEVSGKVTAIEGKILAIREGEETLTFKTSETTEVFLVSSPSQAGLEEGPLGPPQKIDLGQIMVGDLVQASLVAEAGREFSASSLTLIR